MHHQQQRTCTELVAAVGVGLRVATTPRTSPTSYSSPAFGEFKAPILACWYNRFGNQRAASENVIHLSHSWERDEVAPRAARVLRAAPHGRLCRSEVRVQRQS